MRDTVIAGVGMTSFGKFIDRSFASLTSEAVSCALRDSNAQASDVQQVYYSNSTAGIIYGQESVRGQHAVRGSGLDGVPLINVENACASGATALNQAWLSVASGQVDVAIAVGCEKLNSPKRELAFAAAQSALDQTRLDQIQKSFGPAGTGSVFMDYYAQCARDYMSLSGATPADYAQVAVRITHTAHSSQGAVRRDPHDRRCTVLPIDLGSTDFADVRAHVGRRSRRRLSQLRQSLRAGSRSQCIFVQSPSGRVQRESPGSLVKQPGAPMNLPRISPTEVDVVEVHDAGTVKLVSGAAEADDLGVDTLHRRDHRGRGVVQGSPVSGGDHRALRVAVSPVPAELP